MLKTEVDGQGSSENYIPIRGTVLKKGNPHKSLNVYYFAPSFKGSRKICRETIVLFLVIMISRHKYYMKEDNLEKYKLIDAVK